MNPFKFIDKLLSDPPEPEKFRVVKQITLSTSDEVLEEVYLLQENKFAGIWFQVDSDPRPDRLLKLAEICNQKDQ